LDREEAEEKLLEKDVELGTYLLRPSEGKASHYRCTPIKRNTPTDNIIKQLRLKLGLYPRSNWSRG